VMIEKIIQTVLWIAVRLSFDHSDECQSGSDDVQMKSLDQYHIVIHVSEGTVRFLERLLQFLVVTNMRQIVLKLVTMERSMTTVMILQTVKIVTVIAILRVDDV